VDSGARNVVLVSRKGAHSHAAKDLLQELKKQTVRVYSEACDIADSDELKNLLDCLREMNMPQVRGVIQGAMVLRVSTWPAIAFILSIQLI
jgi:short-subunit dehydrogenase involved in D-alanine esterification of teichoic acids